MVTAPPSLTARIARLLKRIIILLAVMAVSLLGLRIYDSQRGPPLELWHTFIPHELPIATLDHADWAAYRRAEADIFAAVDSEVTRKLPPDERVSINRYFAGSPVYPGHFAQDWNHSFELAPDGPPKGAVVLLHGLTDSPYSMRHIARSYRDHGFVAIAIRLPGHGTVPSGLTEVEWQDWLAATRLAVREARGIVGPSLPLHLVGYSNGGALALKYALDALDDPALPRPDRLVLLSPMIGVTGFARFAGLAALPALLPAFAKAAWLSILPEFNPFKYNSFPVNGARQSYLLTVALQQQIVRQADSGALEKLPPVLTFQSILDATVSTPAVISALYGHLPANGSELVLIDINRASHLGDLLTPAADTPPSRLLPPPPRRYRATILTNAGPGQQEMVARVTGPGRTEDTTQRLGMTYPSDVYSLSHIALPFPADDSLYGGEPDPDEDFGIHLGRITARGERGALVIGLDSLLRMSFNPFYPYMMERIEQDMR